MRHQEVVPQVAVAASLGLFREEAAQPVGGAPRRAVTAVRPERSDDARLGRHVGEAEQLSVEGDERARAAQRELGDRRRVRRAECARGSFAIGVLRKVVRSPVVIACVAGILLRIALNKVSRGITPQPAVMQMMDSRLSFREIMRRADRLTALLWTAAAAVAGLLVLLRRLT